MKNSLDKSRWQEFFDRLSQQSKEKCVRVEVLGDELGDQVTENWSALEGISYDPREEELDIFTEEADHRIEHPMQILIQGDENEVSAIEVIDDEEQKQIISFRAAA